jgi:hypothetical protein
MRCIIKIHKMLKVLMFCSLLNHNLVTKSWIWSFIAKLKSTIVKIIKTQYKVKKGFYNIICILSFSFHKRNSVLGLSFHHLLIFFLLLLQMCVSTNVCFVKCVFLQLLVLPSAISFVYFQIHLGKLYFLFLHNACCSNERSYISCCGGWLEFGIRDVAFEVKVFNKYGTFDRITNMSMEDPSYAYLNCDLLNRVALTTITLRVKSSHI